MSRRTFIAPSKYIQGPGEMAHLGEHAKTFGKKALVLISEGGKKRFGEALDKGFQESELTISDVIFNGECSKNEINRVVDTIKENDCEMVIGVGGGKIFDTAKAAAYYTDLPVIICPTIAASDAPCSALSVVYTEEGEVEEYLFLKQNPNMVIMDTEVISKSPLRLVVSGMGDALATYFEARAVYKNDGDNVAGGKPLHTGIALAELCYKMLLSDGPKAKIALEEGALTKSVEAVIEANTLLSGLGFENGGIAAAHAVHNGLASLHECHEMYHGEKVSFGVITQLLLENASEEELEEVLKFCVTVGLPVTLQEVGVTDVTEEKLRKVAAIAASKEETAQNMPFEVTEDSIYYAMLAADGCGKKALEVKKKCC